MRCDREIDINGLPKIRPLAGSASMTHCAVAANI
jgi:hypothetical protein